MAENQQITPDHLRCPHCWGTMRGVGSHRWHTRVSGRVMRYAYRCGLCGHEWIIDKHMESAVVVETRPPPIVETRQPELVRPSKKVAKRT